MKSKSTAIILCFFLGWIGAHKFYLGQVGAGIIYLLLAWTGIPAFIAFIEFFMLLLMDQQTFAARFNPHYHGGHGHQQIAQNVTVNIPSSHPAMSQPQHAIAGTPHQDVGGQLQKLNDLRVAGVLTEEEFAAQKQKVLAL